MVSRGRSGAWLLAGTLALLGFVPPAWAGRWSLELVDGSLIAETGVVLDAAGRPLIAFGATPLRLNGLLERASRALGGR